MANRFARKTGNWNASDVWSDTPSGSASADYIPTTGDVAMANSFTVTVNVNATCAEVRNDSTGGATTGGKFTLASAITLTANVYVGNTTTHCVEFASNSPNSATVVGTSTGGENNGACISNQATGTLYVTGGGTGGNYGGSTGNYQKAINNGSTGTVTATGNMTGGSGTYAAGVSNGSSGTITITGNATGGSATNCYGAYNYSAGIVSFSGNSTGGSGSLAVGTYNASTGTMTVQGYAIANNHPNDSLANAATGCQNASTGLFYIGGLKFGNGGVSPTVGSKFFFAAGGVQAAYIYDGNAGSQVNLNAGTMDYPAVGNVRYGTTYNSGSQTGTCYVPAAASVLYGVNVDNTTGTATLSAADIRSALGLASANLDTQLSAKPTAQGVWEYATRTLTSGGGVTAQQVWEYSTRALSDKADFTLSSAYDAAKTAASASAVSAIPTTPLLAANYTAPPSVSAIRTELDTNSTKLANLDAAITTRLASASYTAPDNANISTIKTVTDHLATALEADGLVYRFTENALEQAPSGGGGGGGADAEAIWTYPTRTITSGGVTAQQVWEYVSTALPDNAETTLALLAELKTRLEEQVPEGPVVVIPAPGPGQTTAWTMCYDEAGEPESGVTITIACVKSTDAGAFDTAPVTLTSDEDGLAAGPIPRGAGLTFTAKRGTNGKPVKFAGADAATLALPSLLGAP